MRGMGWWCMNARVWRSKNGVVSIDIDRLGLGGVCDQQKLGRPSKGQVAGVAGESAEKAGQARAQACRRRAAQNVRGIVVS